MSVYILRWSENASINFLCTSTPARAYKRRPVYPSIYLPLCRHPGGFFLVAGNEWSRQRQSQGGDEFSAKPATATRSDEILGGRRKVARPRKLGGWKSAQWKSNNRTFAFGGKADVVMRLRFHGRFVEKASGQFHYVVGVKEKFQWGGGRCAGTLQLEKNRSIFWRRLRFFLKKQAAKYFYVDGEEGALDGCSLDYLLISPRKGSKYLFVGG